MADENYLLSHYFLIKLLFLSIKQIIKPLGRLCGTGMFKCIPPEDAFLIPEIDVSFSLLSKILAEDNNIYYRNKYFNNSAVNSACGLRLSLKKLNMVNLFYHYLRAPDCKYLRCYLLTHLNT